MKKRWFNSMLSNVELEYKCRLSKLTDSLGPFENTNVSEGPIRNDIEKNTQSWSNKDSSNYSNVDHCQTPFRRPVVTTVFLIGTVVALWLGIGATVPIDKSLTLGLFQIDSIV